MAIKQDADAFSKAKEAALTVDTLTRDIKDKREALKKAKAELTTHRKAVLGALGRKPRGPRKAKLVEHCEHGTKLSGYCEECQDKTRQERQDKTQAPNQ